MNQTKTQVTIEGVIVKAEERELAQFKKADYLIRVDYSTPNGPYEAHYPVEKRLKDGDRILAVGTYVTAQCRIRAYEGRNTGRWYLSLDAYAIEAKVDADADAEETQQPPADAGDDPMPF